MKAGAAAANGGPIAAVAGLSHMRIQRHTEKRIT
jgi:hypothetical protein